MTFASKDDLNDILVDWAKAANSWNGNHTWLQPPGQKWARAFSSSCHPSAFSIIPHSTHASCLPGKTP